MHDLEPTLRDYASLFVRRWWVIVAAVATCLALALVWTERQTPYYQSSAAILINQGSTSDIFDPVSGGAYSYADRLAENEARLLTSGLVADAAIEELGYTAFVSVEVDDSADILTVIAESEVPSEAQETAQTYAEAYLTVRQERFASQRLSTAATLIERLEEIDTQIETATGEELIRLQLQRRDLAESSDLLNLAVEVADGSAAQIIDNAYLPGAPFTPQVRRTVLLGGILGVMFGAGAILLFDALDRSVKTREMLESLTPGAPNLALVPSLGRSPSRSNSLVALHDPTSSSAEAFRTLRAALQYVAVDGDLRVIQIASAHSSAGKTTIAANLAVTLAASGQAVAVVDCDLRRPRLHQVFGVPQVPGLSSAIIGAVPIANCVHEVAGVSAIAPLLIPSGPIPPGPAELLGSEAGQRTIEQIKKMVDIVILDTPPVLAVADTMVLSRYVDASILVVDAKSTNRADVGRAYDRLVQSGAPVVGTVLNRAKIGGVNGYGYGYQTDQSSRGIAGWFSRRDEAASVETLSGSEIPRIEMAAAKRAQPEPVEPVAVSQPRPVREPAPATVQQFLDPEATKVPRIQPAQQPAVRRAVKPAVSEPASVSTAAPSSDSRTWADDILIVLDD